MTARKRTPKAHTLRIIGGNWRTRKVTFPETGALRPTGDRIRETLFNWLMHDIRGSVCLDLFAGSGILSIEALSRGAAHVHVVDNDKNAIDSIRRNLQVLGASDTTYTLSTMSAQQWLKEEALPVDIVFLDPPFNDGSLYSICKVIAEKGGPRVAVYLESGEPIETDQLPADWDLQRQKSAGNVHYGLVRFDNGG